MKAVNTLRRAIALAALTWAAVPAQAQNTIKIGELNSYKAQPAFLEPYKKGMELAIDEINAAGGVMGKKFELITRDGNLVVRDVGANPDQPNQIVIASEEDRRKLEPPSHRIAPAGQIPGTVSLRLSISRASCPRVMLI